MEQWKEVTGFENLYEVSNTGKVRSIKRNTTRGKVLKPMIDKDGYHRQCLCKGNKKHYRRVHRLVAEAFLPNPNNLKQINHKDEDKTNNHIENLEWCTAQYNSTYNDVHIRRGNKKRIPVIGIAPSGEVSAFDSATDAAEILGIARHNIVSCIHGRRKTAGGYRWSRTGKDDGTV